MSERNPADYAACQAARRIRDDMGELAELLPDTIGGLTDHIATLEAQLAEIAEVDRYTCHGVNNDFTDDGGFRWIKADDFDAILDKYAK